MSTGDGHRNRAFEESFLGGAVRQAGTSLEWVEDVRERLAWAERNYGRESYLGKTLAEMLTNTAEEGLDIGGWPVLTALILDALEMDDDLRAEGVMELQEIAALGAEVNYRVDRMREKFVEHLRQRIVAEPPEPPVSCEPDAVPQRVPQP